MTVTDGDGWQSLLRANAADPSPFARLARTHALAMGGDALITLALAGSLFFSISPHAARGRVILSLAFTMAPFAVVAPLLGPAIDRSRRGRRFVLVATLVLRGAACVVMAQVLDSLFLFPVAFVVLVLSKGYSVVKSSFVPAVVDDPAALVEANAKLAIVGVVAGFVAAGPGVLLLQFADARWALWLAAAVFVLGAISAATLPAARRRPAAPAGSAVTLSVGDVATAPPRPPKGDGFGLSWRVQLTAAAMALLRALVGFLTFLVAFGFRRAHAPSWQFGLVLAASMAATLLGAAVAPVLRRRWHEERIILVSLAAVAAAAVGVTYAGARLWVVLLAAAVGAAASCAKLAFDAIVQRDALEHARSQSFARFEAGFQLVWVAGALLPVALSTPLRQGELVIALSAGAGAIAYGLGTRARTRRRVSPAAG